MTSDSRRSDVCVAVATHRRNNTEDDVMPPEPYGSEGVTGEYFVMAPPRYYGIASSPFRVYAS